MAWVSTSPLIKTYTLEEFWELPEPPDHSKLELIAGVLYMTPPPGYLHEDVVSRLILLLTEHLLKSGRGRLYVPRAGIWRTPHTWLEPIYFMCPPKLKLGWSLITGPPQIWLSKSFRLVRQSTTATPKQIPMLRWV